MDAFRFKVMALTRGVFAFRDVDALIVLFCSLGGIEVALVACGDKCSCILYCLSQLPELIVENLKSVSPSEIVLNKGMFSKESTTYQNRGIISLVPLLQSGSGSKHRSLPC